MALRRPYSYNQYRGHVRTSAPAAEPITAANVKDQIRLDIADDDDLIDLYIIAAREVAEEITGLALITQTWQMTLDHWPATGEQWWDGVREMPISELAATGRAANIILPRYPLQDVTAVTADGTAVTVADTFIVDDQQSPGRLVIKDGVAWPSVLQSANGVVITYDAGFGDTATDVPAALRVALMQMVAYMYEHRGDCDTIDAYKASGASAAFGRYRAVQL